MTSDTRQNNPRGETAQAGASRQQEQFQDSTGRQMGGGHGGNRFADNIREHMEVIGADGVRVGTVDHVEGDRIKLTRSESGAGRGIGAHAGHHHYIALGLVAGIEGNKVRLSADGDVAYGMEEEK